MDPRDFLELARKLSQKSPELTEARYRTSISRAYYSAFHIIKPLSEKIDPSIALETSSEIHEKVIKALKGSGKHWVLGDKLYNLRDNRNTADYHLNETLGEDFVKRSILLADNLITKASRISI